MDFNLQQDTVRQDVIRLQDTLKQQPVIQQKDSLRPVVDTATVCTRNSIYDVTFHDSLNLVNQIDLRHLQNFPYTFTGINRSRYEEQKAELVKHLRNGEELPPDPFHHDWVLPLMFFSVLLYGIIYREAIRFSKGIIKFISLRGVNEYDSREIGALFHWQSTVFNLASFINISLFAFYAAGWYNLLPSGGSKIVYWLVSLGIIIVSLTLRHVVCVATGNLSGQKEIFREYLMGIYQAYRLGAVFLVIITALILYTTIFPDNLLFMAGFAFTGLLYLVRFLRLFLIFINRHVSIFYFILYLCALEILPVVIIIRYVTGLV